MKSSLLFFVTLILFLSGCKSSTEPMSNNKLGSSITVTSSSTPSLDGGGRWFAGLDTGVWYDVNIAYSLNNSSSTAKDISYKLEIGEYKNGKFFSGYGDLFFDGDSTMSGIVTVSGNLTSVLNVQPTIGIGRKNAKDWSSPYGYRLTLYDKGSNDLLVITDSLSGSTPQNRFHGIIYTTETSPDPLGVFDGPDDGDWKALSDTTIKCFPLFPNPSSLGAEIQYQTRNDLDSVFITLNKTRSYVIDTLFIFNEAKSQGQYGLTLQFPQIRHGMYRLFFQVRRKGSTISTRGDVIVSN